MNWIQVTNPENIPANEGRTVELGPLSVALFNLGDRFVAIENRCPHKGGPLADGIIGGTTVTCPLHSWRVCLETGEVTKGCADGNIGVRRFDVKVENGLIMMAVDQNAFKAQAA